MAKSEELPVQRATDPPRPERRQRLSLAIVGLLIFAILLAATGQLLLKHGMQVATARAHASGGSLVFAAATSPMVLGGLAVFAVSAVAWLAVLSKVPLRIPYPFNALNHLIIFAGKPALRPPTSYLLTSG